MWACALIVIISSNAMAAQPPASEEILVVNQCSGEVTAYPVGSSGNVAPISPVSGIATPVGIAFDTKDRLYVSNYCNHTVTVYPAHSKGRVAPIAALGGLPGSGGNWGGFGILVDSNDNLYVQSRDGSISVYPPGSSGMPAPSSVITGLPNGGIALDSSGNIYVAFTDQSNQGRQTIEAYSLNSSGKTTLFATIAGPSTGLVGNTSIALDHGGDIYVAEDTKIDGIPPSIAVFASGSNGDVAPTGLITGSKTLLDRPGPIALDSQGNIYVANFSDTKPTFIAVYPSGSNGNIAPSALIQGTTTYGDFPGALALDSTGNLYVANYSFSNVKVYPPGSTGNAVPSAIIGGGTTTDMASTGGIAVDSSGKIYILGNVLSNPARGVAVFPPGSDADSPYNSLLTGLSGVGLSSASSIAVDKAANIYLTYREFPQSKVTMFAAGSSGNAEPAATIAGPNTGLDSPEGIALDPTGNIYVSDLNLGGTADASIHIYPPKSNGNVKPSAGLNGLNSPVGIALDSFLNLYVPDYAPGGRAIEVFPSGSNGNVSPSASIQDNAAGFAVTLDSAGNIYVPDFSNGGLPAINVYPLGSNGNVTPTAIISGPATALANPVAVAIGPLFSPSTTPTPTATPTSSSSRTPTPTTTATPTATSTRTVTPTSTPTATASSGVLTFSPKSMTFPATLTLPPSGATSQPERLTLTNPRTRKQNAPIVVETVDISPLGQLKVTPVTAGCGIPAQIQPGGSCVLDVTFTPNAVGTQPATLMVTTNSGAQPIIKIPVAGVGKAANLSLSPTSINFAKTAIGHPSAAKTVTLTNKNANPLTLTYSTPISIGGTGASSFAISANTCTSGSLAPNDGTCSLQVTFRPGKAGRQSAEISINDNAAKSPHLIELSGTGR